MGLDSVQLCGRTRSGKVRLIEDYRRDTHDEEVAEVAPGATPKLGEDANLPEDEDEDKDPELDKGSEILASEEGKGGARCLSFGILPGLVRLLESDESATGWGWMGRSPFAMR